MSSQSGSGSGSYTPTPYPPTNVPAAPSAPSSAAAQSPRPEHHLHKSSDVLPGSGSGAQDRAPESRIPGPQSRSPGTHASQTGAWLAMEKQQQQERAQGQGQWRTPELDREGRNAWTEERPLGVRPTERGGVAVGGRDDVPETHASATDKVVGKTQKVMGKATGNPELHERGELRESGGKAAARGEGRAPHD